MSTEVTCRKIARECIAMRVRVLNRVVTKIYDDCLRPYGLRAAQQNILVAVSLMKLATPSELERRLSLDKSTVSRNVERMRARGWLEVVPGADARTQSFRLTAQGRRMLEGAVPAWERAQEQAAALLGADGVALLTKTAGQMGMP